MNFVTVALDCCIEVATIVEKVFQKVIIDEVVRDIVLLDVTHIPPYSFCSWYVNIIALLL